MPNLAILAALPREIAAVVRGTRPDADLLRQGIHLHRLPGCIVVAAGMGSRRVTLALESALKTSPGITTLISAGLAGACTGRLTPGTVTEAGMIIDAQSGERHTAAAEGTTLITTHAIASVQEKIRLAATYKADLVDMEAATVARLAAAHGLRFRAIKAVSDAHDFELASLSHFATQHGHFRTGAFAFHTALRPHTWRKTMHLGRNSNRALAALTVALNAAINEVH
ncbi:phosphorylase [Terriglobus saanensis]|uniref:phosphorylase family protein n=1 Tax=Terriglobus saanensis TaxID=870903 RepID=UPI0002E07DBF|nr:phosphorylase [Terriglobus saanensis]